MIKKITVTNPLNETLELELAAPEKSGLLVRAVEGLGPTKANINTTELATSDGALFNSARSGSRNIVLSLYFLRNVSESIEELRQLTYKYFPLKLPVILSITTDEREVQVTGYVETNSPNIFNELAGCQISIICPSAFLYSIEKTVTVISGLVPQFSFPFSNPSIDEDLLVMGEYQSEQSKIINYEGDSETGVDVVVKATGAVSNLQIYNSATRELMKIEDSKLTQIIGSGIVDGDVIDIHTQVGNKSIYLTRDGIEHNILNALSSDSKWFKLIKGENSFAYIADSGSTHIEITIINDTVYEGV